MKRKYVNLAIGLSIYFIPLAVFSYFDKSGSASIGWGLMGVFIGIGAVAYLDKD